MTAVTASAILAALVVVGPWSVLRQSGAEDVAVHRLPGDAGVESARSVALAAVKRWEIGGRWGNPWFSPDGQYFFGTSDAEAGLVVGRVDGTDVHVLERNVGFAAWAPDSRAIALTVGEAPLRTGGESLPLYLAPIDGSSRQLVGFTDRQYFQYLPSGSLAYSVGTVLHVANPATAQDVAVAGVQVDSDLLNDVPYQLSPDGRFAATMQGTSLAVVDVSSRQSRSLTSTLDPRRWMPYSWSPDGSFLAYAEVTASRTPQVMIYDARTGATSMLLQRPARGAFADLAWSPMGSWLFYTFRPAGTAVEEQATYEVVNTSTGDHETLFTSGLGLRLSPDGVRIGFARTVGEAEQLGDYVAQVSYQ